MTVKELANALKDLPQEYEVAYPNVHDFIHETVGDIQVYTHKKRILLSSKR